MTFSVLTWNILADAYIKPGRYPGVDPEALNPERRRRLLLSRVLEANADVLLLQEVEPLAFGAIQAALGGDYAGHYAQRRGKPDGSAILVRRAAFEVIELATLHYARCDAGHNQLALLAALRDPSGRTLGVASTHLAWQGREVPARDHLGRLQLLELMERRDSLLSGCGAWLLGGDFNALSQSPVVEGALQRGFALSCRAQRPWDTVNIGGRRRKLDYLLYMGGLHPMPRPLPPLSADLPLPTLREPSDHLPVTVDYRWT